MELEGPWHGCMPMEHLLQRHKRLTRGETFSGHVDLGAKSRDANLPPNGGNALFCTKILTPEIRLNPRR